MIPKVALRLCKSLILEYNLSALNIVQERHREKRKVHLESRLGGKLQKPRRRGLKLTEIIVIKVLQIEAQRTSAASVGPPASPVGKQTTLAHPLPVLSKPDPSTGPVPFPLPKPWNQLEDERVQAATCGLDPNSFAVLWPRDAGGRHCVDDSLVDLKQARY